MEGDDCKGHGAAPPIKLQEECKAGGCGAECGLVEEQVCEHASKAKGRTPGKQTP